MRKLFQPNALIRIIAVAGLVLLVLMSTGPAWLSAPAVWASSPCAGAASGDGQLNATELYHLDTDPNYRNPTGSLNLGTSATLRLRVCQNDVQQVQVLVWRTGDPLNAPSNTYNATVAASDPAGPYDLWQVGVPAPATLIDQWYQFRLIDGSTTNYYHPLSGNSGVGQWSSTLQNPSWKLGTLPGDYAVPSWMKDAVIYQIFPDRFRNGSTANNPVSGRTVYGPTTCNGGPCTVQFHSNWTELPTQPGYGVDFFGGDLQGIIDEINAGYFNDLGVNTLYLNPIFNASSNHGYDTNDFYNIDPYFGDNATFDRFMTAANAHGLRVILDGVFNHVGADSKYVDGYGLNRWPNDVGACEATTSPYRSWIASGSYGSNTCAGGWGWQGWYGYETIPTLLEVDPAKAFIYRGGSPQSPNSVSVMQYWQSKGIAGWRFDAAQTSTHSWYQDMRPYVKATYGTSQTLLLGEVTGGCDWGLYQSYLNGNELDSAMNYCFRDWGVSFANGNAPSGFNTSFNNFRAMIPPSPWYALMNLISSHDSPRALNQVNGDKARLKLLVILQMTLPGAPSIYYGDEVGLPGGSDPDDRRTYPWADQGGSPDTTLYNHFKTVIGLRNAHSALRGGDVQTLLVDDTNNLYSYLRWDAVEKIVVVLNNGTTARTASIPVSTQLPNGTQLFDALNGGTAYTVVNGTVTVPVSAEWGDVLVANGTPPTATPTPNGSTPTAVPPTSTPTATSILPTATPTTTPIPPTATPTSTRVRVTFTVVGYVTSYGQNIFVIGNVPELGNWNTSQAVPLNWVNSNTWSGPVTFTASQGQSIQYKYIVKNPDGSVIWQPDPNRSTTVPTSGSAGVADTWASATSTPVLATATPTPTATSIPATATPTPAGVRVTFTVIGYVTSYGQNIFIVGNVPELGNWNTSQAVPLNWVNNNTWSGPVTFTASRGQAIQYKYIVKNTDGTIIWESGNNHSYTVPLSGTYTQTDNW